MKILSKAAITVRHDVALDLVANLFIARSWMIGSCSIKDLSVTANRNLVVVNREFCADKSLASAMVEPSREHASSPLREISKSYKEANQVSESS